MSEGRNYLPLGTVKTYREGFLRLQGWITFSALAFFTAGLVVMYELLVINVEDQDFRDMLFDYRITREGISYQHKQFANGHLCCHSDVTVFPHTTCNISSAMQRGFAAQQPGCPPGITFTCPQVNSSTCDDLRAVLYPAARLNSTTGQPLDCSMTRRVLLRAEQGSSYGLRAYASGSTAGEQGLPPDLWLDADSFNSGRIHRFVQQVAETADAMFVLPSVPLYKAVSVGNQSLSLSAKWQPEGDDKWGAFGWPPELWPWPPAMSCSNTSQPAVMWLEGDAPVSFSPFQPNITQLQPTFTFTVLSNPPLPIPQYKILPAATADTWSMQWSNIGPFTRYLPDALRDPASGAGLRSASADQQQRVKVLALTAVNLTLGLVAPLGGCQAWQLYRPGVVVQYGQQVWEGSLAELGQLSGQQAAAAARAGVPKVLAVSLHDATEPRPLALPHYAGEIYIYVALVLGGVWMFSTTPLVIMLGVMVLNVQRNRGLPIFFYKYMRKYRGW